MSESITLTITVSFERAAYIAALLELWSDNDFESSSVMKLLPTLIRDIGLELELVSDFTPRFSDYCRAFEWSDRDKEAVRAVFALATGRQLID